MPRHFNIAGPCVSDLHYMLPAAERLKGVRALIEAQSCFVIHAPRQSGKTTATRDLARALTESGRYAAAVLTVEAGAAFDDVQTAEPAIGRAWSVGTENQLPEELRPPADAGAGAPAGAMVADILARWCRACPRPVVVFLDEIDSLQPAVLTSVLKQLRGGFPERPTGFPHALALVGLRDVRDYVLSGGTGRSGGGSPFNISAASVSLDLFTREQIGELYAQHTEETGQSFAPEAVDAVYEATCGQPWLVNALAREATASNPAQTVLAEHIVDARESLIQRRVTHLESLGERLRDPRVRRVIEPILAGTYPEGAIPDDLIYVEELGLIRRGPSGSTDIANPIYREVIPRVLAHTTFSFIPPLRPTWLTPGGAIDAGALMRAFADFWRQHGEPIMRTIDYHEVAPQLVLMAFLHRVVNGGGTVDREYAAGSGRIDLCVRAPGLTMAIELKVWRDGGRDPLTAGLVQLDAYLERLGLSSGWLVIFDRRSARVPGAVFGSAVTASGRAVEVLRAS